MSIKINGNTISKPTFNGVSLSKVTVNGTQVWPTMYYKLGTSGDYHLSCRQEDASYVDIASKLGGGQLPDIEDSSITSVVIDDWIAPTKTDYWFKQCKATTFDISKLDTSKVTDFTDMFRACENVITLNVDGFSLDSAKELDGMFFGDTALTTIYCNNAWNSSSVTTSNYMFGDCTALVGAIAYDISKTDMTYANPTTGYFTTV